MFLLVIAGCLCLGLSLCVYLSFCSPYRIRNWRGLILLVVTFTVYSVFTSIVPFCQLYLIYFLFFIDVHSFRCLFHTICVFYCVIESFFYLFTVEEARLLNTRSLPRRLPLPDNYGEQFIDRISNVYEKSQEDFRICFAGWFNGVDQSSCDSIYEENILEYISMATYGVKYWNEMTKKQQKYVSRLFHKGYLKKYPKQRLKIKSGYNDRIQLKNPYRDLIQYTHYPLMKYLLSACARSITVMMLKTMGYEYHVVDNVAFYIRKFTKKTR